MGNNRRVHLSNAQIKLSVEAIEDHIQYLEGFYDEKPTTEVEQFYYERVGKLKKLKKRFKRFLNDEIST